MRISFRRRPKPKMIDKRELEAIVGKKLEAYIRREELQSCLLEIERDERKKRLWDAMTPSKKLRLLRYAMVRKKEQDGKKKGI